MTNHLSFELPEGMEPPPGDTHQLAITTDTPGLTLYCERMSEYHAQQLQDRLEQRLRGSQPVMTLPLERRGPVRFNVVHAVVWEVVAAVPKGPQP